MVGHPPWLYRSLTSGLRSVSTRMAMYSSFSIRTTRGSAREVRSSTWHQWHHVAPMSRKMSFPSAPARASASGSQSLQRIPASSTMPPPFPLSYTMSGGDTWFQGADQPRYWR